MNHVINYAIILLLLLNIHPAGARTIDRRFHKTYKDIKEAILHLKHGDGDVTITPWNRDAIDIVVVYRARLTGSGADETFEVEFERRNNRITVTGREPSFRWGLFSSQKIYEYTYTIKAPSNTQLVLDGTDGDVRIRAWRETIEINGVDGDIRLNDVVAPSVFISVTDGDCFLKDISAKLTVYLEDGDVDINGIESSSCSIRAKDGDIHIVHASGVFRLECVDGDINLHNAYAERLDARAIDGDLDIDLRSFRDTRADLKTVDGDIKVTLERGFSAKLTLSTRDGTVNTRLSKVDYEERRKDFFSGSLHGGNGLIRVQTVDGDILVIER